MDGIHRLIQKIIHFTQFHPTRTTLNDFILNIYTTAIELRMFYSSLQTQFSHQTTDRMDDVDQITLDPTERKASVFQMVCLHAVVPMAGVETRWNTAHCICIVIIDSQVRS